MVKKVYTKEQRYLQKMTELGFIRRNMWVHVDDLKRLKKYAEKLRTERMKK